MEKCYKWQPSNSKNILGLPAFLLGVPAEKSGRAIHCNLFYFAEKANQKRIFAAIPNAGLIMNNSK